MKNKIGLGIALMAIFSLATSSALFAEEQNSNEENLKAGVKASLKIDDDSDNTVSTDIDSKIEITNENNSEDSDKIREDKKDDSRVDDNDTEDKNTEENGEDISSESHRNTIADSIKNLLEVADNNHSIGAEVRVIAQEQSDSNEKVSRAIQQIQEKGKFKSFLFGTDYKNTSTLKVELEKTNTQIEQLKALSAKTTDTIDKVTLNTQVELLQSEQVTIQAFIDLHENKFSLFGWLVKMFNK